MLAFKCQHSQLLFPSDYVKQWGRKYGIGLGPDPVSEVLDSAYHLKKAEAIQPGSDIWMFPVGVTHAGIDEVDVTDQEFAANAAILHSDDPQMFKRTKILLDKQKQTVKDNADAAYAKAQEEFKK